MTQPRYDDELAVWTRFAIAAVESGRFRPPPTWTMSEEAYVALAAAELADDMLRFWQQRYDALHAPPDKGTDSETKRG